jgi:hypothetical protein
VSKPLDTEGLRILCAVRDGVMGANSNGRYIIPGQARPDRRTRESLRSRGLIANRFSHERGYYWFLTEKGRTALHEAGEFTGTSES